MALRLRGRVIGASMGDRDRQQQPQQADDQPRWERNFQFEKWSLDLRVLHSKFRELIVVVRIECDRAV